MIGTQIQIEANELKAAIKKFEDLFPGELDKCVQNAITETQIRLMASYPAATGQTKMGWKIRKFGNANWQLYNENKVALFLEEGTKDHGPVTAKFLQWRTAQGSYRRAKRVRGIQARYYLAQQVPFAQQTVTDMISRKIRELLS